MGLISSSGNDCISPIKHVYEFKKEFNLATYESSLTMINLEGAGHDFYKFSSVRAHTIPYGIEPFLRNLYEGVCEKRDMDLE